MRILLLWELIVWTTWLVVVSSWLVSHQSIDHIGSAPNTPGGKIRYYILTCPANILCDFGLWKSHAAIITLGVPQLSEVVDHYIPPPFYTCSSWHWKFETRHLQLLWDLIGAWGEWGKKTRKEPPLHRAIKIRIAPVNKLNCRNTILIQQILRCIHLAPRLFRSREITDQLAEEWTAGGWGERWYYTFCWEVKRFFLVYNCSSEEIVWGNQ